MFSHSHQKVEVDICLSSDKYVFNKVQKKDELFMNFLTKPTNLVDERGVGPVEKKPAGGTIRKSKTCCCSIVSMKHLRLSDRGAHGAQGLR
jgi:hypothetical protein